MSYFPSDGTFQGFESSKLCDLLHILDRKKSCISVRMN